MTLKRKLDKEFNTFAREEFNIRGFLNVAPALINKGKLPIELEREYASHREKAYRLVELSRELQNISVHAF